MEQRFHSSKVQVRSNTTSDSPGTLSGYAAKFSYPGDQHLSEYLGNFRERIDRNCFERSLRSGDEVAATINHDPSLLLGKTRNKTLRLSTDRIGLRMEVDLPNTSYARDLVHLVARGDMSQQSFAFLVDEDQWSEECDPDDPDCSVRIRTLKSVRLLDVACVTAPAYLDTDLQVDHDSTQAAPRGLYDYFPTGIPESMPMEMRSRIITAHEHRSTARQHRQNLINFILS